MNEAKEVRSEPPRMYRRKRGNSQSIVVRYNHVKEMQAYYKAIMRKRSERREVRVLKNVVERRAGESMPDLIKRLDAEGKL